MKQHINIEDGDLEFIGARIDNAVGAMDRFTALLDKISSKTWELRIFGRIVMAFGGRDVEKT